QNGMDVVRAQDRGQCGADDETLLAAAALEARLMITNDRDFLRIHAAWQATGQAHAGNVYWQNSISIGEAIRRILNYAANTAPDNAANMVKYL
ncbi:MAG TPA: DUF5615 family PIN-like protein, partial [Gemmataceae bacterium]